MNASRKYRPTYAVAARAVDLRESGERGTQGIAHDGGHRNELCAVIDHLVIDFVGKYNESGPLRETCQRLENGAGIDGACRIIRIDDHDGASSRRDQSRNLLRVRNETVLGPARVVHRATAIQRHGG